MVGGVTVAVWTGLLPGPLAVCGIALAITAVGGVRAWGRWQRDPTTATVLGAPHLAEIAEMLQDLAGKPPGLHVLGPSSAGVIISGGTGGTSHTGDTGETGGAGGTGADRHSHYGLSARPSPLSPETAHGLARAVLRIRHPEATTAHLVPGQNSVHHLLVWNTSVTTG